MICKCDAVVLHDFVVEYENFVASLSSAAAQGSDSLSDSASDWSN